LGSSEARQCRFTSLVEVVTRPLGFTLSASTEAFGSALAFALALQGGAFAFAFGGGGGAGGVLGLGRHPTGLGGAAAAGSSGGRATSAGATNRPPGGSTPGLRFGGGAFGRMAGASPWGCGSRGISGRGLGILGITSAQGTSLRDPRSVSLERSEKSRSCGDEDLVELALFAVRKDGTNGCRGNMGSCGDGTSDGLAATSTPLPCFAMFATTAPVVPPRPGVGSCFTSCRRRSSSARR